MMKKMKDAKLESIKANVSEQMNKYVSQKQ